MTTPLPTTIDDQWRALEADAEQTAGWQLQLARPMKGHPLFLATHDHKRALLLRVAAAVIPDRSQWPKCNGLDVIGVELGGHTYLGVMLRDSKFSDVFSSLTEDLGRRLETVDGDPGRSVAAFLGRLGRWQRFLAISATGLGPEAQRGLFGELHLLHTTLLPKLGAPAVFGWVGPTRAHQDFQYPSAWIEVKTSLAKQPQSVRITSERQLDNTRGANLLLHVLALEAQLGNPNTLPHMVSLVRKDLGSVPAAEDFFDDSLVAAGYLEQHAPKYESPGYAVRSTSSFRVDHTFPRIIESTLPPGVGDVSYELSLDACRGHSISAETFVASLAATMSLSTGPDICKT